MKVDRPAQAVRAVAALKSLYPDADCELTFKGPLQLAVAVILSAQCTDKRVNLVTPALFKRYKTAADFAAADPAELEALIRSTGFFRSKARSIREMAATVVRDFGGRVPDTMNELLTLRGVARKTANVILNVAYGKSEGVVVDTHMKRVAFRLGLTRRSDPVQVERDLMSCLPREDWHYFGIGAIWHGRRVCSARKPACSRCTLVAFCPKRGVART
ncbi:MAG: DNA-(apurinic or apyrimidinic site) lyase [Elusimicrobia bacterium]|nr:MAG: DNA-(apurinic or apyrimidinic site) lyase [Elusimicrobiota bacterium]